MKRLATREEVAQLVAYLLSDAASFITAVFILSMVVCRAIDTRITSALQPITAARFG